MAAPHVAGSIVLMEDGGNHTPIAQKAVLINTADWWTSNNTPSTGDDAQVFTTAGGTGITDWDRAFGWGYLDLGEAYANRTDYFVTSLIPRNDNATEDDYKLFAGHMFANESATMVWEKRGVYVAGTPPATTYALSDLNVRLYDEADGSEEDVDWDGDDNVHQVATASSIDAVIKAYSWSLSFAGAASETFALATEENFVAVDFPETFQGIAVWPSTVQPNEVFNITFWLRNDSTIASHQNEFDLILPAGFTRISGADPVNLGSAAGGGGVTSQIVWTIQASGVAGAANIVSQHTHSSYDESYGAFNWNMGTTVVTDVTPPTPNPMFWGTVPYELTTSQIRMTATTASDPHGPVEYYHDYTSSPTGGIGGTDSGWTGAQTFTDSGLQSNHNYCYRIWARDNPITSSNQTTPSSISCDYTDITTPTGITFGTITTSSIQARSTNTPPNLASGSSGLLVQNATTGDNSGWNQNNNLWTSPGLSPNSPYSFRAYARNGDASTTPFSPSAVRYTLAVTPSAGGVFKSGETALQAGWGANGNPAGTEYLAENTTVATNSGWITDTFWTEGGLTCGVAYSFRVKARNSDGTETGWVNLGSQVTGTDTDGDLLANCIDPDDDNDGVNDPLDCGSLSANVWAVPSEATGLMLTHAAGTTTLGWNAPAAPGTTLPLGYDTLLTASSALWNVANASCVEVNDADLTASHAGDPLSGDVFFFLARAQSACADGDPGSGTALPRAARDCNNCGHLLCDQGVALDAGCDACVQAVCNVDSFCCTNSWDSICVNEVTTICGQTCPGVESIDASKARSLRGQTPAGQR